MSDPLKLHFPVEGLKTPHQCLDTATILENEARARSDKVLASQEAAMSSEREEKNRYAATANLIVGIVLVLLVAALFNAGGM